jgi:hypothetical protein
MKNIMEVKITQWNRNEQLIDGGGGGGVYSG